MISKIVFYPLSVLFFALYILKYYWFSKSGTFISLFILDVVHLTLAGFAIGIVWRISQKGARFNTSLGTTFLFLIVWFWFFSSLKSHPEHVDKNFFLIINLLTGPVYWSCVKLGQTNLNWILFCIGGMVYWAWMARLYQVLLFERWRTHVKTSYPASPGIRIFYYRIALIIAVLVCAGTLVVHIQLWRIPVYRVSLTKILRWRPLFCFSACGFPFS